MKDGKVSDRKRLGLALLLSCGILGACQIPPSEACVQYVNCQEHFDEVNGLETDDLQEVYGEEGLCWRDEQAATSCTSTCEVATERLADGLAATGDDPGPCD